MPDQGDVVKYTIAMRLLHYLWVIFYYRPLLGCTVGPKLGSSKKVMVKRVMSVYVVYLILRRYENVKLQPFMH